MKWSECCKEANVSVGFYGVFGGEPEWLIDCCCSQIPVKFCPYCGHDLSQPVYRSLEEALASLLNGPPITICFDVDGVLCDDSDPSIPYEERLPYPWVAETLTKLADAGNRIVIDTARHMKKFDGDRDKASEYGGEKLWFWLNRHGIPHEELHMGKPSADIYLDDRGCRVESNAGTTYWLRNFIPTLSATQKK